MASNRVRRRCLGCKIVVATLVSVATVGADLVCLAHQNQAATSLRLDSGLKDECANTFESSLNADAIRHSEIFAVDATYQRRIHVDDLVRSSSRFCLDQSIKHWSPEGRSALSQTQDLGLKATPSPNFQAYKEWTATAITSPVEVPGRPSRVAGRPRSPQRYTGIIRYKKRNVCEISSAHEHAPSSPPRSAAGQRPGPPPQVPEYRVMPLSVVLAIAPPIYMSR